MTSDQPTKLDPLWLKLVSIAGFAASLSACSVAEPLTVRSDLATAAPNITQIAMAIPENATDAPVTQMASALQRSFESRGLTIAPEGAMIADYALAMTPATIGVQQPPSDSGDEEVVWISPPREAKRFDECEAMELRGTLVLINRETSEVAYRGKARTIDCDFGAEAITALAEGLVADFSAKTAR